jgi:hypothetical protein
MAMWFPALVFAFGPAKALGTGKIQGDAMNLRRGLLWLWGVLSAVWIAFMVGVLMWWLSLGAQWHLAIMASAACAIVPPLIVYGIGWVMAWIIRGFSHKTRGDL